MVRARDLPLDVLRSRVRAGELERVLHGVYGAPVGPGAPWEVALRTLLRRAAAVHVSRPGDHWFSHTTAAVLWGCQVDPVPQTVHVTTPPAGGHRRPAGGGVLVHRTTGGDERDRSPQTLPLPVCSVERAVLDSVRTLPDPDGLVVADSGLRAGADPVVLDRMLTEGAAGRGIARARRVLAAADPRADSPGESRLRWVLRAADLEPPDLQVAVSTRLGWRWVDLGWAGRRVGVEFDGRLKYGGVAGAGSAAVFEEKRREDALAEEGWRLVRVTWDDLRRPDEIVDRVRRALRSAAYRMKQERRLVRT